MIADLVAGLLVDTTAQPVLSLLACEGDRPVGHILFTRADLEPDPQGIKAAILAPLAVIPEAQSRGIGRQLAEEGISKLEIQGVDLVFVLGHPAYYPRFGFVPAGAAGFEAPFPIPEKDAEAWMVLPLRAGLLGAVAGTVRCADVMNRPEHWQE